MKNYFIEKYITYYTKNSIQDVQLIERFKVPDEKTGREFIKAADLHYVENPRGLSVYESIKMTVSERVNGVLNYKIYYKQYENGGIVSNV